MSVHREDWSSCNTDPSLNPSLGGKYGKVHYGDPRKWEDREDEVIEVVDGKWRRRVSGASSLRERYNCRAEDGEPIAY